MGSLGSCLPLNEQSATSLTIHLLVWMRALSPMPLLVQGQSSSAARSKEARSEGREARISQRPMDTTRAPALSAVVRPKVRPLLLQTEQKVLHPLGVGSEVSHDALF